ncbi:amidohydrolase family protein [Anaerobacillus sp. CMMVII]|uniref:amidohydrolase family protein n=1 Tax=Anaerobacillus sp. CMMVII TaxID=2755588 RepID=UPI0021B7B5F0|nr:amidohydrolase family protein [Anaerobacillus sp. CMMVII]MCT8138483.1 amidohydrolase family protein [Anaerobacillus sp. CMMVII]
MNAYVIRGKKIVTVSKKGTILDGAIVVRYGKIREVGKWEIIKEQFPDLKVIDCSDHVITPSLVDCHTHLLEFAPSSLYPVTEETHFLAGKAILFHALSSGITALGEQVCGHPLCDFSIDEYREAVRNLPLDVSFATTSITIGFKELAHFTSMTKSKPVEKRDLINQTIIFQLAKESEYPGENLFINATPANFTAADVPRAGELIYSEAELTKIVETFHLLNKEIGVHVAGEEGIRLALNAKVDVLHHAHGITNELIELALQQGTKIVATPLGGTHLEPNSPENIANLTEKQIPVSIATDAYLPPYPDVPWLPYKDQQLRGPESLMTIAAPAMKLLNERHVDENKILALLTANPAKVLGKGKQFGSLAKGLEANFLVTEGIPGLEITDIEKIKAVYYKGKKVINREKNS